MTEDTDWLKKNPMMSLWRSSRFFGQDMDGSLMVNDQKSKNDVLVVSHMPRRSNIPTEKLKQMDFKFPAPVSKKTGIKKPVTRPSKFVVPQVVVSRPSMNPRSGETKAGMQRQGFVKPNARPSVLSRPGSTNTNPSNSLTSNSRKVQRTPIAVDKFNQHSVKSSADVSLLSQSKVVNQSTPNETAVLVSILKQRRNSGRICTRNLLDGKKLAAVKRVNFNGSFNDISHEKVNEGREEVVTVNKEEASAVPPSPQQRKEDLKTESDEESTVAFSNFKPLSDEDDAKLQNSNGENKESVMENLNKCYTHEKETKNSDENGDENGKSGFSGKFISGLMDLWKTYHNGVNHIQTELQIIDENFQRTLQLMMDNEIEEKLNEYDGEKHKLYQKLKELEVEFREKVKTHTDIKSIFLWYIGRKKSIFSMQSQLEENFEKTLHAITAKYAEGSVVGNEETKERKENVEIPAGEIVHKKKTVKRVSGAKRKSGCTSADRKRLTPRKRNSREAKVSDGSTPDNTPARRRKLSRKIEKQIRNLFEEE